jgi:hypothetical protein
LPIGFRKPHVIMDHRVKPGGDEERLSLFEKALVRVNAVSRDRGFAVLASTNAC